MTAQTWTLDLGREIAAWGACRSAPSDLAGYPEQVPVCEDVPMPLSARYAEAADAARGEAHAWATLVEKSAELVTYDLPPLPEHWSEQLIPCWFMDPATNVMTLVCLLPMGERYGPGLPFKREVGS